MCYNEVHGRGITVLTDRFRAILKLTASAAAGPITIGRLLYIFFAFVLNPGRVEKHMLDARTIVRLSYMCNSLWVIIQRSFIPGYQWDYVIR